MQGSRLCGRSSWEPRRKEWPEFGQRLSDVYGAGARADAGAAVSDAAFAKIISQRVLP